tara:strand:- start:12 stop:242 length:231 start_codon:yes stop_codon:yes gene_type:complete
MVEYLELIAVMDDLKYLGRLNKEDFKELLFPDAVDSYLNPKWTLFQNNFLDFLWSCSLDKIKILVHYINDCKEGKL